LLDPKIAQPHFHLGVLKLRQGHPEEAAEHLDEAFRLAPAWKEVEALRDKVKKSASTQHLDKN
jgi:hypothetical protein